MDYGTRLESASNLIRQNLLKTKFDIQIVDDGTSRKVKNSDSGSLIRLEYVYVLRSPLETEIHKSEI